jgi:ABC-2 type transport system ATP-binding protein
MKEKRTAPRWGEGSIRIERVRLLDGDDTERYVYNPGDKVVVEAAYSVKKTIRKPVFGIGIFRSDGLYVSGINHLWHRDPMEIDELAEGSSGVVTCTVPSLPLLMGSYYISYYCYDHSELAPTPVDHMEKALLFEVMEGNVIEHGMVSIPTTWEIKKDEVHEPA